MKYFLLLFLLIQALPAHAAPNVVASIRPLHALVASVMGDTGTPVLLVDGVQSPHGFHLKPSHIQAIYHADLVFYISPRLESFLLNALHNAPVATDAIALADHRGMVLLNRRQGVWDTHQYSLHQAHDKGAIDPHIWLDPNNAILMVEAIAQALSKRYPEHKEIFAQNAKRTITRLSALHRQIGGELQSVADRPFILFHDAFQYFERAYGLASVGAIALEPEQPPGAEQLRNIRRALRQSQAVCVFSEPEFNRKWVATVTEGTPARTSVLDEQGIALTPGPELYFSLMQHLAATFRDCLQGSTDAH